MDKNRRTSNLIEPYKQLRFGIAFLALNFFFAVLILGVFGYYMWDMFQAISVYFKLSHEESLMSLQKFALPAGLGLGIVLLFCASTLYMSIRYTHQFYGPLISIHKFLDALLDDKNPPPITIRKKDQLHELVDKLNLVAKKLSK